MLRERLFATLTSAEPEAEGGFDVERRRRSPPGELVRAAGWPSTPAPGAGRAVVRGTGSRRRGHRRRAPADARSAARRRPRPPTSTSTDARRPTTRPALAAWLADPAVPKVVHDAKAALHALRGRGWSLRRAHQRHRARRLPGPARPAVVRPRRPGGALPAPRAAGRRRGRSERPARRCSAARTRPTRAAEAAMVGPARSPTSPTRSSRAGRERGGTELLRRARAAAGRGARRDGADRHRRRRRLPAELEARVRRRRCSRPRRTAYAVIGQEINLGSPKQLQAVLFDELGMPKTKRTKTGYTTDADALQTCSSRPSTRSSSTCCGTATSPGCRSPSTGCSSPMADDGRIHTTYSRRSPPPGGCRRPTRTCRTSRSAPPRAGGSARRSSSGAGYESLMTADYSQIEMRIMAHLSERRRADRGVPLRRGPAPLSSASRVFGVEPTEVTPRDARQDQGDELRPGLRAVARTGWPSSCGSPPRRPAG